MVIGIFGKRNVGKSSLINTVLGQEFAIVSSFAGTTADPARKRLEINGLGACTLIDTAGIDDVGELGQKRVNKSKQIIKEVDFAILLFAANNFGKNEQDLIKEFNKYDVPFLLVHNQSDIIGLDLNLAKKLKLKYNTDAIEFSCSMLDEDKQAMAVNLLLKKIVEQFNSVEKSIMQGLVNEGDNIVLVCPIDSAAPAKRLILPQVLAIRDILDRGGVANVMQVDQLKAFSLKDVKLVVTDSQAFKEVAEIIPKDFPLTSFSILLSRAKGPFDNYIKGVEVIESLKNGDNILVLESCSHRTTCEDIGRVKIPAMLRNFTGKELNFTYVSSLDAIPLDGDFAMAIQCGACMITQKQLANRIKDLLDANIPISNYGMVIAYVNGIFSRSVACLNNNK